MSRYAFRKEEQGNRVFLLKRSFYGLREAARIRNQTLFPELRNFGFIELKAASCVFMKEWMIIVCYVDDLIICFENSSDIDCVKAALNSKISHQGPRKNIAAPREWRGLEETEANSFKAVKSNLKTCSAKMPWQMRYRRRSAGVAGAEESYHTSNVWQKQSFVSLKDVSRLHRAHGRELTRVQKLILRYRHW